MGFKGLRLDDALGRFRACLEVGTTETPCSWVPAHETSPTSAFTPRSVTWNKYASSF